MDHGRRVGCLCGSGLESRDHVFLHCSVAAQIWAAILPRLGQQNLTLHNWDSLIAWMLTDTPGLSATLEKLLVQALVFLLWGERNSRLHNGSSASTSVLFSRIDRT
ncbi:hypothetical protein IGI04_029318 [Brassica rapa subsp. trilocularis]|uniref:Reverse transcriptase zinc-binding domain-containing protein n=1 Tax=Brassica rapa subsp. trilocularis TaxID=1813537 RepID=A0ABQ7LNG8_BRACM|nr:hypothetical protein IGI04_029318 [Brassica rapa subsp. trilocularis]